MVARLVHRVSQVIAYGPHRPEDAPTHVDLAKGKAVAHVDPTDLLTRPQDYPKLAPGLIRQRRALNGLAWERTRP